MHHPNFALPQQLYNPVRDTALSKMSQFSYHEAMHCQPKSRPSIPLSSTSSNCWIRHVWSSKHTRHLREHGTCLHYSASVVWSRASQTAHRSQRNVEWRHPVRVSCNNSFLNDTVCARSTLYSGWKFPFYVTLVRFSSVPQTAVTSNTSCRHRRHSILQSPSTLHSQH